MSLIKRFLEAVSATAGYGGEINDFVSKIADEAMNRNLRPGENDAEIEKIADKLSCRVYHDRNPTFGLEEIAGELPDLGLKEKQKRPVDPKRFELVAYVRIDSVDEAYRLTNSIDCPWWENDGVKAIKQARSTSVGDIIVSPDGVAFLCKVMGWEELERVNLHEETQTA